MTLNEVFSLIALNKTQFPNWNKDASAAEMQLLAKTWQELFADLPGEMVLTAYKQALKHSEFPIVPANVFNELKKMERLNRPTTEELWRELVNDADFCYSRSQQFQYTGQSILYEGMTIGQESRYIAEYRFKNLHPVNKEFAGNLWRLIDIGSMDNHEREQFHFPRFRRFVEEYFGREEILQALPQAVKVKMLSEGKGESK